MPIPLRVLIAKQEEPVDKDQLRVLRVALAQSSLFLQKHAVIVLQAHTVAMQMRILPAEIAQQEEPVQQDQLRAHRVVLAQSLLLLLKHAVIVLEARTVVAQTQKLLVSIVLLAISVQP